MRNNADPVIHRVTELDLKLTPWTWPFARSHRSAIDAHFAEKQRERPDIWNGRILLGRDPVFAGGRFSAAYFETDFASMLAWRDGVFADPGVFNCFGMGALRCADGVFIMGEMSSHTVNAGRIYFPSGTPEPRDVAGGVVDMAHSVEREMEEETGLTSADYRAASHWYCVLAGAAIAIIRPLHADVSGDAMRTKIEANLARQVQPELSAIHLVRESSDFNARMPRFVTAFIERQFGRSLEAGP
jgi:hypothetical protein